MTTRPVSKLSIAIENLYRTFKRYRPSEDFHGCSHCVSETADAELKQKKLAELTCDDMARYAFKAMTTWGTVDDFKHFLPRIMELVAINEEFPIEIEVAIGKLSYAQWLTWPEKERVVVEQFLEAWWKDTLSQPFSESARLLSRDVLCSLAQVVEDIDPYLSHWESRSDVEASLHLAAFIDRNFDSLDKKDRVGDAFWKQESTMLQAVEWLRRPATRERLERQFLEHCENPYAYLLSEAAEKLDWWTSKNR